jgi:osmotically-inducible protein OsmY
MMKKVLPLLFLAAIPLLQGCVGVALVGGGAAVVMMDDRRTAGIYVEDENIEWKVVGIVSDKFKNAHVNATSYNRRVLLTGEIASEEAKKQLEESVRAIQNLREVQNELTVGGVSSVTSRGNDSLITSTVKTRMVGNNAFKPNHIKVVTEASVVYLMGLVTEAEGNAAVEVARSSSGVSRVVKVFEYLPAK